MAAAADTHVTIVPYFTVPDGKMDEFKAGFKGFYDGVATGTDETLYYGFATCGNKVFCREGYKSAAGALAHIADVDGPLNAALAIVGEGGLDLSVIVMGPAAELDQNPDARGAHAAGVQVLGDGRWQRMKMSVHGARWRGTREMLRPNSVTKLLFPLNLWHLALLRLRACETA